jgi:acyl-CoA thioester hydrolase
MKFTNKQYVRWDDLDALRHVNNAKYLTYAQEARFAWSGMLEMVVARAELDFKLPIYDGNIFVDVTLWVESIGTSSFTMVYEITHDGQLLARVKTVQVTISPETKKSRPINETEREFLSKYLETE